MISLLQGTIEFKGDRFAIINAQGVGYKVFVPPEVLRTVHLGESAKLWTHLQVREDALELYGFQNYAEMSFFETLISVSGVGPKSALGILGIAPLDSLKRAIASGETTYLTKVSGIGKKMAEKIIVELRDKMGGEGVSDSMRQELQSDADVLDALATLGYSAREARDVLAAIPQDISGTQKRLQEALQRLGGKK
jgi:Holliday junction DNA helicase RuvA